MKILIVTPYLGVAYGGTSKVVPEIALGLSSMHNSVDIVTTNANSSEKLNIPLNIWIAKEKYQIQYFNCWHKNDFVLSFSLIMWLNSHISNYDIVHTNTIFSPLIALIQLICIWHHKSYIVTPHGMLEPWALSHKTWKKQIYYALVEKFALQKASAIQVLTLSEENHLNNLQIKTPLILVPNGIHKQEFVNLPEAEIFYQKFPCTRHKTLILFLGRIDPKKGLDLLALAFTKVHALFSDTHLVIAGPDNIGFTSTVQSYFAKAGCLEAVTFTNILTGSLKYAAFAAATLYVAPSYSEGFSMSVLEGMAAGLPCVITTGCNFPEAGEAKAAYIVEADGDEIAEKLIYCLKNPQQAKEMGDRAREFIFTNYTWEQSAQKLSEGYKTVLEKSS